MVRHIQNIIEKCELSPSVCAEIALTASDGKEYKTKLYNLDMILAIGNRVKTNNALDFMQRVETIFKKIKNKNSSAKPLIIFKYNDISLDVSVSPDEDTVWLTKDQIVLSFYKNSS